MTRWVRGSVRSQRFGFLFLLASIAAGALLVTASGLETQPGLMGSAPGFAAPGRLLSSDTSVFIPAAAHVTGAVGTDWRTDLEVYNAGDVMAQYRIALLERDRDNSAPTTIVFNLPPGRAVRYNDILFSVFEFSGSAALWITAISGEVTVSSRTYNQTTGGAYGQYVGGAVESRAIQFGQQGRIIQLTHSRTADTGFRTNVGFLNGTAMTITVQASLYRWDGVLLGTRSYGLEPYMFTQKERIFSQFTQDDVTDGYVVVRTLTPGGRFFAYASVVDNRTGDPTYIPALTLDESGAPGPTPAPTQTQTVSPTVTPTRTPTQPSAQLNLTPFTPDGWDAPVVASGQPGTTPSGGLIGDTTTYVNLAFGNEGPADAFFPAASESVHVLFDDQYLGYLSSGDPITLSQGDWVSARDVQISGIPAGQHTITMVIDPLDIVSEADEGDNSYTFTGTWSGAQARASRPPRPVLSDAGQLLKAPGSGVSSGMVLDRSIAQDPRKRVLARRIGLRQRASGTAKSLTEPVYIPASAHVAGAAGTNWRTDVELHNPGATQAQYEIALLLRNQGNPNPTKVFRSLGPGRSLRLDDALSSVFGFEGGAALRIRPMSGSLLVTSRSYNLTDSGTYGQFVGGAPESEAIEFGEDAVLIQLSHDPAQQSGYRTNLGFVSASASPITVQARMYSADGVLLGTRAYPLEAYMHRQVDRIFQSVTGGEVVDGYIVVRAQTAGGRFFAYASVVDNATGDPVYIPATVLGGAAEPTRTASPSPTAPAATATPTPTPTATSTVGTEAPPNDLCSDAITIQCSSSIDGTTIDATADDGYPFCGSDTTAPGVWYRIIGTGDDITVETCGGAIWDTKISVYTDGCDPALTRCIGGNDDSLCGLQSRISWASTPGREYLVLVHGFRGTTGVFTLNIRCIPPQPTPTRTPTPTMTPTSPQPTPTSPQPTPTSPQPTPTSPQPTPTSPQPTPTSPQPTPTSPQPTPTPPQPTPTSPQPTPTSPPPPTAEP